MTAQEQADTEGLREAAEEVVRRASTKPSHRPATARSYEGWVRESLETLRAALSQGAAHEEHPLTVKDGIGTCQTCGAVGKVGAAHEERGLDVEAVVAALRAIDPSRGYGTVAAERFIAAYSATPEAAPEPVEHSWRFTAENADAAVRYRHETATPEAAPEEGRPEWGPTTRDPIGYDRGPLDRLRATPEAAPEEGCHGRGDARHLCAVHEGGWLDGTASNRHCTIARAATPEAAPATQEPEA